jgi:hcpE
MTYLDNFKRKRMKKYLLLLSALFFTGCLNVIGIGQKQDDSWQQPKDEKIVQNKEQISRNAIEILIPKCEEGDAEACNDLGVNYELLKEYENALTNYKRACDAKVQVGCANLGTLYELGLGVKKNPKKAVSIYKESCNGGGMQACYHLGNAYRKGEIVKRDYYLAMQAYTNACNAGDLPSCANIGAMYELGLGVNKDEKRAYGIYKVACFRGLSKACPQMKRLGSKLGM